MSMVTKNIIFCLALLGLLMLSGCEKNNNQVQDGALDKNKAKNEAESATKNIAASNEDNQSGKPSLLNDCQEGKVDLPNYGDPGKRLENCFVEYPGEPSREDKSYYIVEDICGQFSQQFMENMLGRKLFKVEPSAIPTVNNCSYYFDDKQYLMLNLEYLSIDNQKKGNEFAGYKVEKNKQIPMDNLVVWQEDDLINVIYLVLNPNKFLSLRPSSKEALSKDEFLNTAANIALAIKNYK